MHPLEAEAVFVFPVIREIGMIGAYYFDLGTDDLFEFLQWKFDLQDGPDLQIILGRKEKTGPADVRHQVVPVMQFRLGWIP